MALDFGFYDSIESGGAYDRLYSAEDFSSFFDGILSDGVLRTYGTGFKVTIKDATTREIIIGAGKAWLQGTWNMLKEPMPYIIPSHSTDHLEAVILKVDKGNRENSILVRAFENKITVITDTERGIYEYCLAGIRVTADKIVRVESHIGQGTPTTPYANIIVGGQGGGVGHHWDPDVPYNGGEYFNLLTNIASGMFSHAEGCQTSATGMFSHAEGNSTKSENQSTHAEGQGTTASGPYSHAEGNNTTASAQYSHAEGQGTKAESDCAHAEGYRTVAKSSSTPGVHAEGYETKATGGLGSHAEGQGTTASGETSHAEGKSCKALGTGSHAEGRNTTASGDSAHAEGYYTQAKAYYSHAEGDNTIAEGQASHAEGSRTTAGEYSHAEGLSSNASGFGSHAEGQGTKASGQFAHAEGQGTTASGQFAHAGGSSSTAGNTGAFVHGQRLISSSNYQAVFGKYNNAYADGDYAFIIGNGTNPDNLSDALTVDWDGNVVCNSITTRTQAAQIAMHNDTNDGIRLQDLPIVFKPYGYTPEQTNTPRIVGVRSENPVLTSDTHYMTQIVSWYVELPNGYKA